MKLKKLLDKYNINPELIIRKALEEEVKRCILNSVEEKAKKLSENFQRYLTKK